MLESRVIKLQDGETVKFLELYASERSLYDVSCDGYKNRDIRKAAVTRISEAMAIPGFGPNEVIAKFKNLRSSYCQELKKIGDSERSGAGTDDIYVPKVIWFHTMNSFIRPFVQQRPTTSNLVIKTNTPALNKKVSQHETEVTNIDVPSKTLTTGDSTEMTNTPKTTGKRKAPFQSYSSKIKKRPHFSNVGDMYSTVDNLDEISNHAAQYPKHDSYHYFGKYISSLLRSIGPPTALRLQEQITRLITRTMCPEPQHPPQSPWGPSTSNQCSDSVVSNFSADISSDEACI